VEPSSVKNLVCGDVTNCRALFFVELGASRIEIIRGTDKKLVKTGLIACYKQVLLGHLTFSCYCPQADLFRVICHDAHFTFFALYFEP
jgi:hypothetical protein